MPVLVHQTPGASVDAHNTWLTIEQRNKVSRASDGALWTIVHDELIIVEPLGAPKFFNAEGRNVTPYWHHKGEMV